MFTYGPGIRASYKILSDSLMFRSIIPFAAGVTEEMEGVTWCRHWLTYDAIKDSDSPDYLITDACVDIYFSMLWKKSVVCVSCIL